MVAQLTGGELRRCIISIVGMGGLGKTSLAKKIYNHTAIETRFHVRAWVCVSQEYNTIDLLKKIIKSFTMPSKEEWEMMETEEDLEKWLFKFLEQKRYLVVIDDVWKPEAWESLKRAFLEKNIGSRVLLTTRNMNVASSADQRSLPHRLRFLTEDESWELFCKKAFPNINNSSPSCCPPGFEELGRKMVAKCDGLPLGIIILGGLLSKKQPPSINEWQRVLNRISQNFMQDQSQISQILSLSYNDLPYQLKSCFLYVGHYPEDYGIETEKLIQLWMAEGFIQHQQGREPMEDIAEDYLNELIDRSMIQVGSKCVNGVVVACRIHDLLPDFSISKAKEEGFFEFSGQEDEFATSRLRQRRLTIHFDQINRFVCLNNCPPYLRSFICLFVNGRSFPLEQFRFISTNFKFLKVLDLETNREYAERSPQSMLESIGEMIHLRYLSLRGMDLKDLPASIENLQRLQTLKMSWLNPCEFPDVIWKMKQLRHIEGYSIKGKTGRLKIDTLINIRTLRSICADDLIEKDLRNLTNLRDLGIKEVSDSNANTLCASLSRLVSLQHLSLNAWGQGHEAPIVLQSLKCYHLLSLDLDCKLEKLPNDLLHEFLPNLTELSLSKCQLEEDPMATLERLPNLLELSMTWGAYLGKEIICLAKGFPRLKFLFMRALDNLEEWRVEDGSMPNLEALIIVDCTKLKKVPEGFKFLSKLRKLEFRLMPKAFEDRVLRGEDSYKVQHVPSVTFIQ